MKYALAKNMVTMMGGWRPETYCLFQNEFIKKVGSVNPRLPSKKNREVLIHFVFMLLNHLKMSFQIGQCSRNPVFQSRVFGLIDS